MLPILKTTAKSVQTTAEVLTLGVKSKIKLATYVILLTRYIQLIKLVNQL